MTRSRRITFLATAVVIPLSAVAIAACGGGGATAATPPAASQPPAKSVSTQTPTIRVAHSSLGQILVNSTGRTLYLFKGDTGMTSACAAACATAWPPLLATGNPTAGSGLTASKLGTITRLDGTKQVTYSGHPLYMFIKDKKPGDVDGEGVTAFGASWFAVSPAGNQISSTHGGSSSSSRPTTPAAPAAPATTTTTTTTQPAPPPAAKPTPPPSNGIPQNGGGDGDADNSGGPSDGDGNI
jgi:predicted lipoprotein with Yx(FWY)xxD motif